MSLSDDDVSEILRIIDESPLAEIRIETEGFSLHVLKTGGEPAPPTAAASPTAAAPPTAAAVPTAVVTVEAPMLGMFYAADGPSERPFVEPGSHVEPDTTVCIIEVMKMMNSVPAGVTGTVVEVCAENGAVVEEGAPLFRVERS
jgi:acetyl-CoA carboxylase biotin carboxyl carrier protein